MKVCTVSEMRDLDRTAIERFGIKEELLMEDAGEATYFVILKEFGVCGRRFVVFCGGGNNGGDGFVIARKIHSNGGKVTVFILGGRDKFKGAAKMNLEILIELSIKVQDVQNLGSVRRALRRCEGIVDGIFGTGLTREVDGIHLRVIEAINESEKPVFSVDIPSGVNGDTGCIMGTAVKANYTVTFGLPKIGNCLYPGAALCGKLYVSHISFPPALYASDALTIAINDWIPLRPRDPNGHKGDFGEVLFIAGATSYLGAPYFAALSFLKAGGGYSRLAAPRSIIPSVASRGSEIVFVPQEETASGSIARENKLKLLALSEEMDMVVLGPGLSLDPETQGLALDLISAIKKPLLIDGDGLTALSKAPAVIKTRKEPTILTPHLGEMARITRTNMPEIEANKIEILRHTAKDLNAVIVLKGAHSLIGCPNGKVFINLSGNSGMATAGSGDILTGTIAAMFGLGILLEDAVRKGVFIHGYSGDLAAEEKGEDGITAQDIMDYLPQAMKSDREGQPHLKQRYRGVHLV